MTKLKDMTAEERRAYNREASRKSYQKHRKGMFTNELRAAYGMAPVGSKRKPDPKPSNVIAFPAPQRKQSKPKSSIYQYKLGMTRRYNANNPMTYAEALALRTAQLSGEYVHPIELEMALAKIARHGVRKVKKVELQLPILSPEIREQLNGALIFKLATAIAQARSTSFPEALSA